MDLSLMPSKGLEALGLGPMELWQAALSGDDRVRCCSTGIWVRCVDLPFPPEWELLEGAFDPSRLDELYVGAEPTPRELELWRDAWANDALTNGDADVIPGYLIVEAPVGSGIFVVLLQTCYPCAEIETRVEGVFRSERRARAHLEASGWVG